MKNFLKSFVLLFVALVFLFTGTASAALNQDDLNSIIQGTQFFKGAFTGCIATTLSGSDNAAQIYNYLTGKGLSPVQAAGVMGNLQAESGFDPQRVQGTAPGTGDKPEITVDGVTGYGLAQWTDKGRQQNLLDFANSQGKSSGDLGLQLDFIYHEANPGGTRPNAWPEQLKQTEVQAATFAWEDNYENPKETHQQNRVDFANAILARASELASSAGTGSTPANNGQTIIALDPGHSTFSNNSSKNAQTGLYDTDTSGAPNEMSNAWIAANKIKPLLEAKGYAVVITKQSEDESINLSQRAQRANDSHAALLFTMHADSDARWLAYPDANSTRTPKDGPRLDGTNGLVHPEIMGPSKSYAEAMAPIIASETNTPSYSPTSFNDYYGQNGLIGNGLNPGNTPVQTILSSIPEVYSEIAPDVLPSDAFAQAVTDAISQTIPPTGANTPGGSGTSTGCAQSGGPITSIAQQEYDAWQAGDDAYKQQARAKYRDSSDGSPDGEAWCANFVSWVYKTAGTPFTGGFSGGWRVPSAYIIGTAQNVVWTSRSENKFPPAPGDFIMVHYDSGVSGGSIDGIPITHAAIIISVDGDKITTIEGNTNHSNITSQTYNNFVLGNNIAQIVGWGHVQ